MTMFLLGRLVLCGALREPKARMDNLFADVA